jgi:hypothetical protein
MRHTNAQTTMNIYTQALSDSLRAAMEDFDHEMSAIEAHQASKDSEHK